MSSDLEDLTEEHKVLLLKIAKKLLTGEDNVEG